MVKPIAQAVVAQITRNLVSFGYQGLTEKQVQQEVDKLQAGEATTGIIAMFARNMLIENGYLEEEA